MDYRGVYMIIIDETTQNMIEISDKEDQLLRRGNMLNTLGLMRAAFANNGILTKERYALLVRLNWSESPFGNALSNSIEKTWNKSRKLLEDVNLLVYYRKNKLMVENPL